MVLKINSKAFLGPIGDDLPSLIPLLFALLMFFSTFTHSFAVFESRNRAFTDDLAVLKLGATLKSNGYIENSDEFQKRCKNVGPLGISFYSAVTNAATAKEHFMAEHNLTDEEYKGIDIYALKPFNLGGTPLECKNTDSAIPTAYGRALSVKVFPIAVEDNKVVKPMHLVVVAWR